MKHLRKFNEGKISQAFIYGLLVLTSTVQNIAKRIKGTYVPIKYKDKKIGSEINKKLVIMLDYTLFDTIKYAISKKYKKEAIESKSVTNLIKLRTGIDVYEVIDFIITNSRPENVEFSTNKKLRDDQEKKVNDMLEVLKKYKGVFKKLDDDIEEWNELANTLKQLGDVMKDLDPRRHNDPNYVPKRDTISSLEKGLDVINKSQQPKELDELLDKVSKYGIGSLTSKEQEDLDKYSNSESMKHLRKYNENTQEFDIEFVISKIMDHFDDDKVISRFDEEVLEWVDDDWADEYDSKYDWYLDHNNGEAQDVVINELINWYTNEFGRISVDNHSDLFNRIKQEYVCLNYF